MLQAVEQLSNHAKPFPAEAIPFLTNLVATVGWDANARVTRSHPDSVVDLIASHPQWHNTRQPSGTYPVDLQAFESQSVGFPDETRGVEWFMAYAVAYGFNPWVSAFEESTPEFPGSLLREVIDQQYWGLLEQLVQLPGAPGIHQVLTSAVGGYDVLGETSVAACLVHAEGGHDGLARLLRHALAPYLPAVGVWGVATPEALKVLLSQAPFPADPKAAQKIERKWTARVKARDLSGSSHAEMSQAAGLLDQGNMAATSASREGLKALGMVKQALSGAWGKVTSKGSFDVQTDAGLSPDFLVRPIEVAGTSLDGRWTPVAACLARNLREVGSAVCVALVEYEHWLGKPHLSPYTPGWERAHAGVLTPALGVEWRPGVLQDGIIALAVLGRAVSGPYQWNMEAQIKEGKFSPAGMEIEQTLFGIDDMQAFALKHREAAVRFTEMALEKASKPGSRALALAWGQALQRFPTWLEGAPELGTRLLRALVRDGQLIDIPSISPANAAPYRPLRSTAPSHQWAGLSSVVLALGRPYGIGDASFSIPVDLKPLPLEERRLMAEMAIVFESPRWVEAFAQAAQEGLLDADIAQRFGGWYAQNQKRQKIGSLMAHHWPLARSVQLQSVLPAVSTVSRGPRF